MDFIIIFLQLFFNNVFYTKAKGIKVKKKLVQFYNFIDA